MLLLNGPVTAARPARPADPEPDDQAFEAALVGLLGRAEHLREGIVAARLAGRPAHGLALAQDLMDQVAGFADKHGPPAAISRDATEGQGRAKEFAQLLARVRGLYGSSIRPPGAEPEAAGRQELARRCFHALYEAVVAYFSAFTTRFATSRAARGWVEVAAGFVVDLKYLAQDPLPA